MPNVKVITSERIYRNGDGSLTLEASGRQRLAYAPNKVVRDKVDIEALRALGALKDAGASPSNKDAGSSPTNKAVRVSRSPVEAVKYSRTKQELFTLAAELGVEGLKKKSTNTEIAEAIVAKRDETAEPEVETDDNDNKRQPMTTGSANTPEGGGGNDSETD